MRNKKIELEKSSGHSSIILNSVAESTGLCGGDSGHGGRTRLTLDLNGGCDIVCRVGTNEETYCFDSNEEEYLESLCIEAGGDWELESIFECFLHIVSFLAKKIYGERSSITKHINMAMKFVENDKRKEIERRNKLHTIPHS